MSVTICWMCGGYKTATMEACPECRYRPTDDTVTEVWLLSDEYLSEQALGAAAKFFRNYGEVGIRQVEAAPEPLHSIWLQQRRIELLQRREKWVVILAFATGVAVAGCASAFF